MRVRRRRMRSRRKSTGAIQVNDLVEQSIPGSYVVLYNVADSSGNQAGQLVRRVVVVDRIPPIITLLGNAVLKQTKGAVRGSGCYGVR